MILVDKVTTLPLGILFLVYKGTDQTAPAFSVALPELPFHAGSEDDPLVLLLTERSHLKQKKKMQQHIQIVVDLFPIP